MYHNKLKFIKSIILTITIIFFSGCASTKAPSGWHESPGDVSYNAWGGWIYLEVIPDKAKSIDDFEGNYSNSDLKAGGGEFITFQDSLVYILFENKLVKIPYQRIYQAKLEISKDNKYWFILWSVLGSISTISHGFNIMLSLPTWIIFGSVASSGESRRNRFVLNKTDYVWWVNAKKFSRFPQGLPNDFDLSTLKSKPMD